MDFLAGSSVPALVAAITATLASALAVGRLGNSKPPALLFRTCVYSLAAIALWFGTGGSGLLVAALIVCAGVIESDLRWYLIPDTSCVMLVMIGYWTAALDKDLVTPTLGAVLGGGLLLFVRSAFYRLRGFHGLGLGDVKLVASMGILLGPQDLMFGIAAGAAITGLFHIFMLRAAPNRVALVEGTPAAPLGVGLAVACAAILATKGLTPWR
jgi:Flp pilus assembly protein protease CpaA